MKKSLIIVCITVMATASFSDCNKQDKYLDVKLNAKDVVPATLTDLQAVLDNDQNMNEYYCIMGLVGTDNLYIPDNTLQSLDAPYRNTYLWNENIFEGEPSYDWQYAYQTIAWANIVLEGIDKINTSDTSTWNNIKGSALFYRAFAYYQLAQLFCPQYDSTTASSTLGLPLKLESDVNIVHQRSSLSDTYKQILSDLNQAANLLPISPLYKTRPSQASNEALLSKIFLNMGNYATAYEHVVKALSYNNSLLDFNSLNQTTTSNTLPSFADGNTEIIYYAMALGVPVAWATKSSKGRVDTTLYNSYGENDLRKSTFFRSDGAGLYRFKGTYAGIGQSYNFCGIATNELYLIKSECEIRLAQTASSLLTLNTLLRNRYITGTYTNWQSESPQTILEKIILERRKEMPFTGDLRWEDLRRLNKESAFAKTLSRKYNGETYSIAPNSNRYVLPIPDNEIQLSHIEQNQRQ